jgi:hypothetical protein
MAEETGLSFNQIKDIVLSAQFKFIVNELGVGTPGEADTFKNVMLRYLGTFEASPGRIHHITEGRRKKLEESKNKQ